MHVPAGEPIRALWSPDWYDLDQALTVGREEEMVFFAPTPPEAERRGFALQFQCGLPDLEYLVSADAPARPGPVHWRTTRILAIQHADWGALQSVATGLDYTFELTDGRKVVADSEGERGTGIEPDAGEYIWVNDDDDAVPGYAALPRGLALPTTWELAVTVVVGSPSWQQERPSDWFRQH